MTAAEFSRTLVERLAHASLSQSDAIDEIGMTLSKALLAGGVLHTFGCGHSALIAAEPVYRAGGLVPVNLLGLLPGAAGLVPATLIEKRGDIAGPLLSRHDVGARDIVAVVSHSGATPLVLAVAGEAKRLGARLFALTSHRETPLALMADDVLTTGIAPDDCLAAAHGVRFGSASSVIAGTLLNAAIAAAVAAMAGSGEAPVFRSNHVPGGPEHNTALMTRYGQRVPSWTATATSDDFGATDAA